TVENLAKVLDVPTVYFYALDDDAAELILAFYKLPAGKRAAAVQAVKALP
ncbi:MAG: XRE family transcriptional regulator, partial [Comamonadaceae bacterium]